jgi:hypothetical protein
VNDVRAKYVPPSVEETAFNCPHCGALAKQVWFSMHAIGLKKDATPARVEPALVTDKIFAEEENLETRKRLREWARSMAAGRPAFLWEGRHCDAALGNVELSRCFNCDGVAIWVFDQMLWPRVGFAPLPNPDMPDDVRRDYEEASTVLGVSARSAAALLRLAIQKLCRSLGEKGENINHDIGELVKKGLAERVQKALDVVRVVGNNAVHPGELDLRDDRATAEGLFRLVNLIVEQMISQDKHVDEMFAALPSGARQAIERRDAKPRERT